MSTVGGARAEQCKLAHLAELNVNELTGRSGADLARDVLENIATGGAGGPLVKSNGSTMDGAALEQQAGREALDLNIQEA